MRRVHRAAAAIALAVSFALAGTVGPVAGQVRGNPDYVTMYGRVQWISANQMVIMTDCPLLENQCATSSVPIDLKHVPQGQYRGIRAGTWVIVQGIVPHTPGHHGVLGISVTEVAEWQAP